MQAQILEELTALFRERSGQAPTGAVFQIGLGVLDEKGRVEGRTVTDAGRLQACPNKAQAYIIRPDGESRLVVAALNEKGPYYGAQTLRQLLGAKLTRDAVSIPFATVTDWPVMEERGLWNSAQVMPWLSSLKLNFCTYICARSMDTNGWVRAHLDSKVMELLKRHAMVERVQISHLNYWGHYHPALYKPGIKRPGR